MENTNYPQVLSERILALRKEKGLTQEALAGQLGVSFQAVSKWENGQSCPDIALLPLLAEIFEVPIDGLFGKEIAMEPPIPEAPAPEAAMTVGSIRPPVLEVPPPGKPSLAARLQGVCLILLACLLAALPLVLLAGAGAVRGGKAAFGYRLLHVLSASMEPAIGCGDLILVKSCGPENVRPGDDITYYVNQEVLITHRVIEIRTELYGEQGLWFITKGLNNNIEDLPVEAGQLLGKVTMRLPGALWTWMSEHLVIAVIALILVLLFCWPAAALLIWLAVRKRRKQHL